MKKTLKGLLATTMLVSSMTLGAWSADLSVKDLAADFGTKDGNKYAPILALIKKAKTADAITDAELKGAAEVLSDLAVNLEIDAIGEGYDVLFGLSAPTGVEDDETNMSAGDFISAIMSKILTPTSDVKSDADITMENPGLTAILKKAATKINVPGGAPPKTDAQKFGEILVDPADTRDAIIGKIVAKLGPIAAPIDIDTVLKFIEDNAGDFTPAKKDKIGVDLAIGGGAPVALTIVEQRDNVIAAGAIPAAKQKAFLALINTNNVVDHLIDEGVPAGKQNALLRAIDVNDLAQYVADNPGGVNAAKKANLAAAFGGGGGGGGGGDGAALAAAKAEAKKIHDMKGYPIAIEKAKAEYKKKYEAVLPLDDGLHALKGEDYADLTPEEGKLFTEFYKSPTNHDTLNKLVKAIGADVHKKAALKALLEKDIKHFTFNPNLKEKIEKVISDLS